MQSTVLKLYLCAFTIAALQASLPRSLSRAQGTQTSPIFSKPVASFKVDRLCLIDAMLQLGQQEGVPLGIEYVNRQALEKPISVQMDETTVGEIVQVLLAHGQGLHMARP